MLMVYVDTYLVSQALHTHLLFTPSQGGPSPEDGGFLHVLAANPISLLSMPLTGDSFHYLDLDHIFPSTRGLWKPQLTLAALGCFNAGKVLLHDAGVSSNNVLVMHVAVSIICKCQHPVLI